MYLYHLENASFFMTSKESDFIVPTPCATSLVITCLLSQEVEGWRRFRRFVRRVVSGIRKVPKVIAEVFNNKKPKYNPAILPIPKDISSVLQIKSALIKAKSTHENIKDTFEKGKDARKRLESAGKAVKDVKGVIDLVKSLKKRSTIEETSQLNLCEFSTFDWNQDKKITEEEIEILMEATGLLELDELFGTIDLDQDETVTMEEFLNSTLINELCL